MTKRLMSWAENTDQLSTEQSGFRKHHSTNDKLFELTHAVCQTPRLSTRVGAVFLDIEKAFDRIWHNGLRYELLHMNAPALLLIFSFVQQFFHFYSKKLLLLESPYQLVLDQQNSVYNR